MHVVHALTTAGFTDAITRMSEGDLYAVADGIRRHLASPADEVAWWQATITIDRAVKASGRWRPAVLAARSATTAVQGAARAAGIALPDDRVTCVARAAADVARGLTGGSGSHSAAAFLLEPWARMHLRRPARL